MKKHLLRIILILVLLVTLCVPATISVYAAQPKAHVELPFEQEGTLNGAEYRIRVPANWNGTLLVYAHGYSATLIPPPVQIAPGWGPTSVEEELLDLGYALAGSAFSSGGWAIKEGVQNTLALTNYFKGQVGNPENVIVWGTSLGALVALKSIEKYPGIYDGAISESGPIAGLPMQVDYAFLGICVAYAAAFDWPEEDWGPLGNVRDDIDFWAEVLPILFSQYLNPDNFGKWEYIRLVTDYPAGAFWTMSPWGLPWPFLNFMFAFSDISELERIAKGIVWQNLDHVYSLTEDEITYLEGLGVDASSILADMNATTNIEASEPARKYLERYGGFSGDITGPVITIHNTGDPLCIVAHTAVYRDTVAAAGKADMLFQVFEDSVEHCNFTKDQYIQTVVAMKAWLDGTPPDPADFWAVGFLPGYVPPSWPF